MTERGQSMSETTDYLANLSNTDLMRITVALATEVYQLQDRMHALEEVLRAGGVDLSALDEPVDPAAFEAGSSARRDEFVARVFNALKAAEPESGSS